MPIRISRSKAVPIATAVNSPHALTKRINFLRHAACERASFARRGEDVIFACPVRALDPGQAACLNIDAVDRAED